MTLAQLFTVVVNNAMIYQEFDQSECSIGKSLACGPCCGQRRFTVQSASVSQVDGVLEESSTKQLESERTTQSRLTSSPSSRAAVGTPFCRSFAEQIGMFFSTSETLVIIFTILLSDVRFCRSHRPKQPLTK